ncbi:MAG: hypothetical protein AB8B65_21015 [Kordia sp.]|uniref:hypothetical protein n=1 Tax=Kordia sp. TaxID=1965332 RepID=UPI00385FE3E1
MKNIVVLIVIFLVSSSVISQTVYTTKSGSKYHKSSCKYLKDSRKEFTIKKAESLGFTACEICKSTTKNISSKSVENKERAKSPEKPKTNKRKTASQCRGKKKSGERCQNQTKNIDKRCYLHHK